MAYFYFVYLVFSLQHAACQHATNNMHVAAVFRNDIFASPVDIRQWMWDWLLISAVLEHLDTWQ